MPNGRQIAKPFRKKPVEILAVQLGVGIGGESAVNIATWINYQGGNAGTLGDGAIEIQTLEGQHRADPGDWIIRGVAGEFYPCKPEIFEQTYEPV